MRYMLDSNICIYIVKNKPPVVLDKFREHINEGLCISSITLAELEFGVSASTFPEKNSIALKQFLSAIDVLFFDIEASACYGAIRASLKKQGNVIGPLDMLIAGHALSRGLTLVTNNIREFERVNGLDIVNWI
ncbi:MAG: type II toxin-antitoxin system VapC family toxin [Treponema sp.]|nr:type II toxin-antitoxin system VapC family toxin [Treponema sp.]